MNLNDNPIFLTQKRLVHRGGVLAAILIAAMVGLSLLIGLIAYLTDPNNIYHRNPQEAGKTFYAWIIGIETLVLVIGGFGRISHVIGTERRAGLWDSNRLTPLKPWQLVTGYWFGPPLREFYMAIVLAAAGLLIVIFGKLPISLWLGTQVLTFTTALFLGLLAILIGLDVQKPQHGVAFVVLFVFLQLPSLSLPKFLITNFLLPTYGIVHLFSGNENYTGREWAGLPEIFGVPIPPVVLTLALQAAISVFLWRAAIRKTANPFSLPFFRWEAVALFTILLGVQHGLTWGAWQGHFPEKPDTTVFSDDFPILAVIHAGALFLAIIMLGAASPQPESIRISVLRSGSKHFGPVFSSSSVSLALALGGVAALALGTQCMFAADAWKIYVIAAGNLLNFFLIFSLLLEFCRLQFRRRAIGFVGLWLFILCILPFILGGVFSSSEVAKISLLAPGVVALADPRNQDTNCLLMITAAHFGIVILLFVAWRRQWKELLAKAV